MAKMGILGSLSTVRLLSWGPAHAEGMLIAHVMSDDVDNDIYIYRPYRLLYY